MANDDAELFDVLIIGGGFSGLSAARDLAAAGARIKLLDSFTDHLGGRAYSYPYGEAGLGFDHGAEYVGDLQNGIMQQIATLMPEGMLVNGANLRLPYLWEVMMLNQTRYAFKSTDCPFGIAGVPPQLTTIELIEMLGVLAEMTLIEISIDVVEPWNSPSLARDLDSITVADWLAKKTWLSPVVRDLLTISIEALLSVEPTQISPFYLLWYTACNDGFLNEINDDAGGPQQYWLRGGTSSLAKAYAAPIQDRISQGVTVKSVDLSGDVVVVETTAGTMRAKKVLVATSFATAGRIAFTPEPEPARKTLFSLPMGKTIKCQVFYKSAWWHDSNGLAYDGYVGGANYPILWVMDNTPPNPGTTGPFVLMTFTVGAQVDALGPNPSEAQIRALITGTLRDLFRDDRALEGSAEYAGIKIHGWVPTDKYVGGGPNTVFTPGTLTGDAGKLLNAPWNDKVFFACAENAMNLAPHSTSRSWSLFTKENLPKYDANSVLLPTSKPPFTSRYSDMRRSLGYMDGAMISGQYAASVIGKSLGLAATRGASDKVAAPAATPPRPSAPSPSEISPADVHAVLRSVADTHLAGASDDALRSGAASVGATSRGGAASWLGGAIVSSLKSLGHVADGAAHELELAKLRDFAEAASKAARAEAATAAEHAKGIEETLGKIGERFRKLF